MDLVTLQTRLMEAQAALHKLLTGSLRQRVNYNGQDVTFAATDIGKLTPTSPNYRRCLHLVADPRSATRPIHFILLQDSSCRSCQIHGLS